MKSRIIFWTITIGIIGGYLLFMGGCKNFNGPIDDGTTIVTADTSNTTPTTPNTSNQVCFTQQVLPMLQSNCASSGCHDAASRRDGYDFTSYTTTVRVGIIPGNPDGSRVYKAVASGGGMPPRGRTALTADQRAILRQWIAEGAKNTSCSSGICDTTNITYTKTIAPLLLTNCVGCHSGSAPSGDITLSSYAAVKTFATNGRLLGSVNGQSGFVQMPPVGRLEQCQITQLGIWIRAGALNN